MQPFLGLKESVSASAELSACLLEETWASALATLSTLSATISFSADHRDSLNSLASDEHDELLTDIESDSEDDDTASNVLLSPAPPRHTRLSPYLTEYTLRRGFLLLARAAAKIAAHTLVKYYYYYY